MVELTARTDCRRVFMRFEFDSNQHNFGLLVVVGRDWAAVGKSHSLS